MGHRLRMNDSCDLLRSRYDVLWCWAIRRNLNETSSGLLIGRKSVCSRHHGRLRSSDNSRLRLNDTCICNNIATTISYWTTKAAHAQAKGLAICRCTVAHLKKISIVLCFVRFFSGSLSGDQ